MSIEIGQEYRNSLGGVMVIKGYAALGMNVIGEIWVAESPDTLFGSVTYLVTAEGLVDAGYHKVQAATQ